VPIFSGYSVENRIKETLQLEDKAQSDLEAARRNTAQATRSAFFNVQSLRAQVLALGGRRVVEQARARGHRAG